MGEITEGISRVRNQILTLRDARYTLMGNLMQSVKDRKPVVADALARFRTAFAEMSRKARAERFACVSRLRQGVAGDLDGARRAWMGKNA